MSDLQTLIRDSAEAIPTGPPPYAAIRRQARRRRAVTWSGGVAAAVVLATVVGAGFTLPGRGLDPVAPSRSYAPDNVPVLLDNSSFEVGVDDLKGTDTVRGTLRSTKGDRCLVVDGAPPIFWPQGWEGLTHGDGGFTLLDQDGRSVAEVGDTVVLHGRVLDPASWSGNQVCVAGTTETFMVTAVEVE